MWTNWQYGPVGGLRLQFSAIHGAKGLEADYVFVLGLTTGRYSFPSAIEDDPLIGLVMPAAETFEAAEERRVFYVALTRARRCAFLVTVARMESPFIREMEGRAYEKWVETQD